MDTVTDWISAVCAICSILIAFFAVVIAIKQLKQVNLQLKNLNDSFRNSTLMTVLELENELIRRKVSWDTESFGLRAYGIEVNSQTTEVNQEHLELLIDKENVALENYLNSLDRLAYCIIHEYIADRDWRTEYRDVLFQVVDKKKEQFGVNSSFRNIIKLYNRWKDN